MKNQRTKVIVHFSGNQAEEKKKIPNPTNTVIDVNQF